MTAKWLVFNNTLTYIFCLPILCDYIIVLHSERKQQYSINAYFHLCLRSIRKSLYGGHLLPFTRHVFLLSKIFRHFCSAQDDIISPVSLFGPSSFTKIIIRVRFLFPRMIAMKVEQPLLPSALRFLTIKVLLKLLALSKTSLVI